MTTDTTPTAPTTGREAAKAAGCAWACETCGKRCDGPSPHCDWRDNPCDKWTESADHAVARERDETRALVRALRADVRYLLTLPRGAWPAKDGCGCLQCETARTLNAIMLRAKKEPTP